MGTYKNSTVDTLVKHGLCAACEKPLAEQDKQGGFIRCGVCRGDLNTHVASLRDDRRASGLCIACGRPKLRVSPYCHDCALGAPEKEFDENDMDGWIEWGVKLVKRHRRLFMRLHDPRARRAKR